MTTTDMVSDQTSIQLLEVAEHNLGPSPDNSTNRITNNLEQQMNNQRYAEGNLTGSVE